MDETTDEFAILAQAQVAVSIQPTAPSKVRRMTDRLYRFTVTHPDGSIEMQDVSHVALNRYRNWYRLNRPECKVVIEETQTWVTSDGKAFQELTFKSHPQLPVDPYGTYIKINEGSKVDAQLTIAWELFDFTPPAFVWTEEKARAWKTSVSESRANVKARLDYDRKLTQDNGKVKEDRNVRIYSNANGNLIFSGDALSAFTYITDQGLTLYQVTIYLPQYLQDKITGK